MYSRRATFAPDGNFRQALAPYIDKKKEAPLRGDNHKQRFLRLSPFVLGAGGIKPTPWTNMTNILLLQS